MSDLQNELLKLNNDIALFPGDMQNIVKAARKWAKHKERQHTCCSSSVRTVDYPWPIMEKE